MSFESGFLVRATYRVTSSALEVVNTLHYEGDDPLLGSPASLQALADRLRDDTLVNYRGLYTSGYTIHPIVVTEERDPLAPDAPREQRSSGVAAAGTRAVSGDASPTAVTLVATELTAFVGRSFRGRLFLGGAVRESDHAGNDFGTGVGTWYHQCGLFLDSIPKQPDLVFGPSGATVQYVVYSRTLRGRNSTPYFSPVVSHLRRTQVKWLRSREPEL